MFTAEYIISQILVVFGYICLGLTFATKDYKRMLIFNFGYLLLVLSAYFLLGAYTGMAMLAVAVVRNVIFMFRNKKQNVKSPLDITILVFLLTALAVVAAFTYDGFLSLFSMFASMVYTISVWQRNRRTYRLLGIFSTALWVVYNVHVYSIFGIILEVTMSITALIFFIKDIKNTKTSINLKQRKNF